MTRIAVHAPTSASRKAIYVDQLRRQFQSNSSSWQNTIAILQSFDHSRKLAKEQAFWETFTLLLAVISIGCASVEGELLGVELAQLVEEGKTFTSSAETTSLAYSTLFIVLKGVLSGTSGLLLYALVMRYRTVCKSKILAKQLPPYATFFSTCSGLRSRFLLEALVCTVHMPLLSADRRIWHWGEYNVFCLDQLGLNSGSHEARLISSIHHVDLSSIWLTIKFTFQKFPFEAALSLLVIDWFLTSVALNFFERASNPTETNASDSFWMTIVTITGVGYGDTSPWTLGGKIVIATGGIIGGMVIACLIRVTLIDALQLSPQEQTVLDVARFYRYVRQRKKGAAVLIQRVWRWHRVKATSTNSHTRSQKVRLYAAAEAFRLLRFVQPPTTYSTLSKSSITDMVVKRAERLCEHIESRSATRCAELTQTAELFRSIASS
ncbi:hypothetical protein DVH05_002443 [Phytophthora capsici]|nr:hypothetical protein DVH05_002443 [Phytophthora capsici]